jgi:hypothetical protein
MIDAQSQELNRDKRLKLVWEIQRNLEADVTRPMLGWRNEYFTHAAREEPRPAQLPHSSAGCREVWLDR